MTSTQSLFVVRYLRVHGQETLPGQGHVHPCKNDIGIYNDQANTQHR